MINVETVDLSSRGIALPRDRVGIVVCQPFLVMSAQEPYRWVQTAKQGRLEAIKVTLNVARAAHHQQPKTHFTVFPEYSIPGLEGIELIDATVGQQDWPAGSVVIGGVDALAKGDLVTLAACSNSHLDTEHNDPGLDPISWTG